MKTKSNIIIALLSVLFISAACTSDMEFKDVKLTPVNKLYAPVDGKGLELLKSSTASLFFEWEASKAEDSGAPLYEVIFDKENGDFSNPVYRIVADEMGTQSHATISHKDLNKIWGMAGIEAGATGTLKWTVVSSRGINSVTAKESRKLTLTRLLGFAELPTQLYITGDGSEAGTNVDNALSCSSPEQGVYEIFTKLEAGKKYHFIDNKNPAVARTFYIDNKEIKEGTAEGTVAETAIYRVILDFNIASVKFIQVQKLGLFFCPSNAVIMDLSYKGKGIWQGEGKIEFHQESWGRDERYKFQMEISEDGAASIVHWGPTNASLDSRPGANESQAYYNMAQYGASQWDNKWKFAGEMDGAQVRITIYFNSDKGVYTHTVEKL